MMTEEEKIKKKKEEDERNEKVKAILGITLLLYTLEDKLNKAKDTPLYCREFKQYSNRLLEIIKKGIYDDVIISLVKSDEDLWQSLSRAYTELIETISEASLEDVFIINENIKEYIKQKNESIKNS